MPGMKKYAKKYPKRYRKKKLTLKKLAKRIPKQDLKIYEFDLYQVGGYSNPGTGTELTYLISQGTADNQRAGADISIKSVILDFFVKCFDVYNTMRVSIVRWRKQGVASPTMAPLFNGIPTTAGFWDTDRWEVLMDKQLALNLGPGGAGTDGTIYHKRYKCRINRHVHYETTTLNANQQFILYIQSDSVATPHPSIEVGYAGITFVDQL